MNDPVSTVAAIVGLAFAPAPLAMIAWLLTRPAHDPDPEVTP